jgi:hypothetical protein
MQVGLTLNHEYLLYEEKAPTDLHETKSLIHIPLSQTICALLLISDPTLMAAMQKPRGESTHKATTETSFLTILSKLLVPLMLRVLVALTGADQLRHCFT